MESLIAGSNAMWLLYGISALIGCWCFLQIPVWSERTGLGYRLYQIIGVTLLLTPIPITAGSTLFAPGFIVLAVSVIDGNFDLMYSLPWFVGVLVIVSLLSIILKSSTSKKSAGAKNAKDVKSGILGSDESESADSSNTPLKEKSLKKSVAEKASSNSASTNNGKKKRLDPTF